MDYAIECIRLAGLTDDLEVSDQLVDLASSASCPASLAPLSG
jgi:hypothetical protein